MVDTGTQGKNDSQRKVGQDKFRNGLKRSRKRGFWGRRLPGDGWGGHGDARKKRCAKGAKLRKCHSTVGGLKWTKMDLFRPKWTMLVRFALANTKIQLGMRSV